MVDTADKGEFWGRTTITAPDHSYPKHTHLLDEVRKMRILIADSVPGSNSLLSGILAKGGFTDIEQANSAAEVLEQLRISLQGNASPVAAVLLGMELSDMNGGDLCRTLRACEEWAGIPVIMMTGRAVWDEEIVRGAYDAGATDILFKPIRSVELMPRLISALCLKHEWELRRRREQELVTELAELKVLEARLQYLVKHDDLTGLNNRRYLEQTLEHTVENVRVTSRSSALLYLDLDQFKVINNYEGHSAGDHLLIRVANTLRRHIGPNDGLAHISSDEYAILLDNCSTQSALATAERLRRELDSMRFQHNKKTYHVGASIGVAMITPDEYMTASEVLARADQACFAAKRHGRNMVHLYSQDDTELLQLRSQAEWLPLIRDALANDRFNLMFQPVLDVKTHTIRHYEVLLRMLDNDGKAIKSMDFIAAAEQMGLIHDIDRWVITHAIDVLKHLPPEHADLCLNINLSGHAFQDAHLLPLVRQSLRGSGVKAERITFEITETAAIANFQRTRKMVKQLRALGCRFALDDFGSGFNSYNYLKQFPVDYLKIDGTFISDLLRDPVDQALVKSMVEVAHTLGKETVAEFVSDRETLALVKSYGIDFAQGYYIGAPQPSFLGTDSEALRACQQFLKRNHDD